MTNFTQLLDEADKARAYIDITARLGPSEQLLAFINHDGNLGQEIGLESFDNFSLTTQHELLLSKLDPDALDQMAMEDLDTTIDTTAKILAGLGSISAFGGIVVGGRTGGIIALSAAVLSMIGETLGEVNARNNVHILSYASFNDIRSNFDKLVKYETDVIAKIPHTFGIDEWKKFADYVDTEEEKAAHDPRLEYITNGVNESDVPFSKSGWDAGKFKDAIKWHQAKKKEFDAICEKYVDTFTHIAAFLKAPKGMPFSEKRKVAKHINKLALYTRKACGMSAHFLNIAGRTINRLPHHFESDK